MGIFDFIFDANNYESRKVARDTSKCGIIVSTAYTSDEGFETALLDDSEVYPVERYETKEQAKKGHENWLEFAHDANGKQVTMLSGIGGFAPATVVTIVCK